MQLWALQSKLDPSTAETYQLDKHRALDRALHHRLQSVRLSHFLSPNPGGQHPVTCAYKPVSALIADRKTDAPAVADFLSGSAQCAMAVWRAAYHAPSTVDYPAEPFAHQQELRLPESEAAARHDGHQSPY